MSEDISEVLERLKDGTATEADKAEAKRYILEYKVKQTSLSLDRAMESLRKSFEDLHPEVLTINLRAPEPTESYLLEPPKKKSYKKQTVFDRLNQSNFDKGLG